LNLLLVSSDQLISSLRKLPKNATKTYLSESLKLFAVSKESEDLFSFDTAATYGVSSDTSEEITV
jgi:hypothetical protein